MRPVIFKCPTLIFYLLFGGAIAPLAILPLIPKLGWPTITYWIIDAVELGLLLYALTLVSTKLVLSDEGLWQKLLFSELRLRWEDMVEWRHVSGPNGDYLWIRDRTGRKHQPKRWLVFGRRIAKVVEILQEKGIKGEIVNLKR